MKNLKLINVILGILLFFVVIHAYDIHAHQRKLLENNNSIISFTNKLKKPIQESLFNSILIPSFIFPVKENIIYRISSNFGVRGQVIVGMGGEAGDFHRGIDIVPLSKNAKAIAAADGVVILHYVPTGVLHGVYYRGHPVFGGLIVIKHSAFIYTVYGHLSKTYIYEGMQIKQGQEIGIIGNTGKSTGTHLHFEILFNPINLLKFNK